MEKERRALERLLKRDGGLLKVETVIASARDPKSVLHKHFEWDDSSAAEEWRKHQARHLIQRCNIVIAPQQGTTVRAFVSLPTDRDAGGGYRLMRQVIGQPDLRAQLLTEIEAQINRWNEKAKLYAPEILPWLSEAPVTTDERDELAA